MKMKYSLKGIIQFKGVSYVLKLPFASVGLGKAMEPWITEDVINKIADDLIIKTQNMVTIARSNGDRYDVFLLDVLPKDFNEDYRQKCIGTLISLVKKHLNQTNISSLNESVNKGFGDPYFKFHINQQQLEYKFFNPNTTYNYIISKLSGKECESWAKTQQFLKGLDNILSKCSSIAVAYVSRINDVNVYSFNSAWENIYQAKPIPLKFLIEGIRSDLMGEEHTLGDYVIAWDFGKDVDLRDVSLSLTELIVNINFKANVRNLILEKVFGIVYKMELEALGVKSLFTYTMLQKYNENHQIKEFLKAKDELMADAFEMYWEQIKKDNFEGIVLEEFKAFFHENKKCSYDGGNFLKLYLYQAMSSLILGMKEKNLQIFDFCLEEIAIIFDSIFQKHLSLEFSNIIERNVKVPLMSFGVKFIQDYNENDLNKFVEELNSIKCEKEIHVCKPSNGTLTEVLFFNNDWSEDLKKNILSKHKNLERLEHA